MGWLIGNGVDWRGVFLAAADVMLVILLANLLLLKESPYEIGETEPQANPLNLVDEHEGSSKAALKWALTAFLRSRAFWIVCLLPLGITLLRVGGRRCGRRLGRFRLSWRVHGAGPSRATIKLGCGAIPDRPTAFGKNQN